MTRAQVGAGIGADSAAEKTIWDHLLEYYTEEEAYRWLCAQHPQLDGAVPAVLLAQGREAEVRRVLQRLDGDGYL